jgi:hypothetical protein
MNTVSATEYAQIIGCRLFAGNIRFLPGRDLHKLGKQSGVCNKQPKSQSMAAMTAISQNHSELHRLRTAHCDGSAHAKCEDFFSDAVTVPTKFPTCMRMLVQFEVSAGCSDNISDTDGGKSVARLSDSTQNRQHRL